MFEESQQIVVLSMYVPANLNRRIDLDEDRLKHKNLSGFDA